MDRELVLVARRLDTVSGLDDADIAAQLRRSDSSFASWRPDGRLYLMVLSKCCLEGFCVRAKTATASGKFSIHIAGILDFSRSLASTGWTTISSRWPLPRSASSAMFVARPTWQPEHRRNTLARHVDDFRDTLGVDRQCRPAAGPERLAHTLVEFRTRLASSGRAAGDTFDADAGADQRGAGHPAAVHAEPYHQATARRQDRRDQPGPWASTRRSLRSWRSSTTAIFTRHPSQAHVRFCAPVRNVSVSGKLCSSRPR